MKKALIVQGGWPGHFPRETADLLSDILSRDGFETVVTDDYGAFAQASEYDLVVPQVTNDEIDRDLVDTLVAAVRSGTGLAGCHAGLATSFRSSVRFHYLCGVQWVAHPGDVDVTYRVEIVRPDDPVMRDIPDFDYRSEQYYLHYDPSIEILATTTFSGEHDPAATGVTMPVVFKRRFGEGRVFWSALGHVPSELEHPHARTLIRRGMLWAARGDETGLR